MAPDESHEGAYSGVENLEVLAEAVRYNRFLVDEVVGEAQGAARALDFGAGTGSLSTQVRERGLSVFCVESDPGLRARLEKLGFECHSGLEELADGSLDYIYSLNVLEHIEDDRAVLQGMHAKLKPGGRLFLYVPAFPILYSSMDEKVGHFRRYRRGQLAELARETGFEVERSEYADCLGFPASLLYRLVGSRRGEISVPAVRFYDRIVFPLSRGLDRLGMGRFLGKNALLVMVRPRSDSES